MEQGEFYGKAFDLLEGIYYYQDELSKKLSDITDASQTIFYTIDEYVKTVQKNSTTTQSSSDSISTKIDLLVTKIDKLANSMSGLSNTNGTIMNFSAISFVKDITGIGKALFTSIPYFSVAKKFIPTIADTINELVITLVDKLGNIDEKKLKVVENVTKLFSMKISDFAKNLYEGIPYLMALQKTGLLKWAGRQIGSAISSIVDGMTKKISEDKAKGAVEIINGVGHGIVKFATAIAIATPILLVAKVGLVILNKLIMPSIITIGDKLTPAKIKKIKDGVSAIKHVGIGLIIFSGSLALSAVLLSAAGVSGIAKVAAGVVILFGLAYAFNILGKYKPNIAKGALSILFISATLPLFAFSLAITAALMPKPLAILGIGLTLMGLGLIYAAAGSDGIRQRILWGVLSFGLIGISLILVAYPLNMAAEAFKKNSSVLWQLPLTLLGLGVVYALAGAASELIIPGAIAIGLIGLSLIPFAKSLQMIANIPNVDEQKAKGIERSIKAIVTGIGKSFSELSALEIATLPLKIPAIAAMGLSLMSLAYGVKKWGEMSLTDDQLNKIITNIDKVVSTIPFVFANVGARNNKGKSGISLHGITLANPFEKGDVEEGISSVRNMGNVLESLSRGVEAWLHKGLKAGDAQKIATNVKSILDVIPFVFAGIGQRDKGSKKGIAFNTIFGSFTLDNPFEKGDIEQGISSVRHLGDVLITMKKGIEVWLPGGAMQITPGKIKGIAENISGFLSAIPAAFATLGADEQKSQKTFLGINISRTNIGKGVAALDMLLPKLTQISEAVKNFGADKGSGDNMTKITASLILSMRAMAAQGANNYNVVSFNRFVDGFVKLGKLSTPIDRLTVAMSNFNKVLKEQINLFDPKNPKSSAYTNFVDGIVKLEKMDLSKFNANLSKIASYGVPYEKDKEITTSTSKSPQAVYVPSTSTSTQRSTGLESKIDELVIMMGKFVAKMDEKTTSDNTDTVGAIHELKNLLITQGIKVQPARGF